METTPRPLPTVIPLDETQIVPVNRDLLERAASITGIENPAELVTFAVQLLAQANPDMDVLRELRGELPEFASDI
jgi:hypothetical protein